MNILTAITSEERRLEAEIGKLQKQVEGLRAAAKALQNSSGNGIGKTRKRVMTPAIRAKISASAKKRWAKIRAGGKKSAS